jgi:HlyD family secretion protein
VPYSHLFTAATGRGTALQATWKNALAIWCLLAVGGAVASYSTMTGVSVRAAVKPEPKRQEAVSALGRIEPSSEIINLGAGISPDRLDSLFVARGDLVKKGDLLGYLGGYSEQIAQRDFYRSQFEEARSRLTAEIELSQARIEAAEIHQKQIMEVFPLRIASQDAVIASLQAKLANDQDIFDSQSQLFSRGATSRRLQEDQKATVLQGEANLASANARLAELKRQFEIDQIDAASQIRVARAQLERAKNEFPIASLERQIASADARAHRLAIYAPIDGRILNIRIKPGEDVSGGSILTMGDTRSMRAVAEVYETDIAAVRVGQQATITSYALPRAVSGKVARIGSMVFKNDVLNVDPAARADARVVEVWIDLDDEALLQQLTNLTVDVRISTSVSDVSLVGSHP